MDFCPTAIIVRYKDLINNCLIDFLKETDSFFIKDEETNLYILSERITSNKLTRYFKQNMQNKLEHIRQDIETNYSNFAYKKLIVLDGCTSIHDHFLFDDEVDVFTNRFSLVEKDIKINFQQLECIWNKFFNSCFKNGYLDWIFLKSKDITSLELEKIVKHVFGHTHFFIAPICDKEIIVDSTEQQFKRKSSKDLEKLKIQEISEFIKNKIQ